MKETDYMPKEKLIIISVLFAQLIQMCAMALSPILSEVSKQFPQLSPSQVQMLVSVSSIGGVIASFLVGSLSLVVPKKAMLAAGCACTTAAGLFGFFFFKSFPLLLVWSCMLGFGSGIAIPASSAVVRKFTSPGRREMYMGWLVSASNVGAMIMSYAAGTLAGVHWNYAYLIFLIAVPGFFLSVIVLPADTASHAERAEAAEKKSVSYSELFSHSRIIFCCAVSFLVIFLYNAMPANLSMYINEHSLGGTYEAGIGSTLMLLAGTVGGLIFGKLNKLIGKYTYILGFLLIFSGQMLCAFSGHIILVYISCVLSGFSLSFIMPQVISDASSSVTPALTAAAVSVCMISNSLGSFSTPVITILAGFIGSSVAYRYIISASLALVTAVIIFFILKFSRSEK